MLQEFSRSDEILDKIQDTPFKPQTEEPTSSSIILRVSELVIEEAVTTDVVEQAPPENQENDVAHAAPILYCRELGDHDELDTYRQAMTGSESRKWLKAMNADMRSM
ncbi:hypothetical protein Tco_1512223 [Tanacetum coccineum]